MAWRGEQRALLIGSLVFFLVSVLLTLALAQLGTCGADGSSPVPAGR